MAGRTVLSARLRTALNYIKKGERVADIGTDHAYLPIHLLREGIASRVLAADINRGPLESAKNNLKKEELDTSYMFFEDDISYLGKPVELMTKAEKRKLARQLKKKARLEAKQRKKELKDARKKKKIAGIR